MPILTVLFNLGRSVDEQVMFDWVVTVYQLGQKDKA